MGTAGFQVVSRQVKISKFQNKLLISLLLPGSKGRKQSHTQPGMIITSKVEQVLKIKDDNFLCMRLDKLFYLQKNLHNKDDDIN